MAEFHCAGRVLPERPTADVDRLVHAAFPALVSCGDGAWNADAGTRAGLAHVLAAAIKHLVFSYHHSLADRDHSLGELYVPELPGPGAGDAAARRPVRAALVAAIFEEELSRHQRSQTSCGAAR